MIILLVLLPLVVLARESSKLSQLHDGDAIVRTTTVHSVDNAVDVLPSFAYRPQPDFKFRYANYMREIAPQTTSGLSSSENGANNRNDKKGPPHIPTPYFLPNFTAGTPLFEGYRMLFANRQREPKTKLDEKKNSRLNYADYRSIEKLLTRITSQKIPKTVEYI
ncbi:hypothetical protein OSTOST_01843 [Ostertagia ostertagi]